MFQKPFKYQKDFETFFGFKKLRENKTALT